MKISAAFIFFLFVGRVRAWVDYSLVFTNVEMNEFNRTVFVNGSAWLTKYNRTTTVLNLSILLLHDLHNDMEISLHATEIVSNRPRDTPILDARMDFCEFLKNPYKSSRSILINIFYKTLVKYGNFATSCPFPKGEVYVKNLVVDNDLLPAYMPGEKWKFCVTFYQRNVIIIRATFTMVVDRTTKLRESLIRKLG